MTPRERQLATIRHEPTDRISLDAICIENEPDIAALLGIAVEDVPDRLGIDGRGVAAGYTGVHPRIMVDTLCRRAVLRYASLLSTSGLCDR